MSKYILTSDGELYHYGVKGMKWGKRRYQNKDGSLTPAGKKRLRKPPEMYEPGSLTKIPSVRKADKMILNDVRAYKKSLKGQGVMVREGKLGKRRKETALQIKRDSQKLRAEKKEAQKAANGRIRTQKILGVIGVVTVASAATYAATKYARKAKTAKGFDFSYLKDRLKNNGKVRTKTPAKRNIPLLGKPKTPSGIDIGYLKRRAYRR